MTSHRIGVNLRVSGNCDQGARKYMEDNHVIKFLKKDTDDYEFAYFGIFDGHGGPEASAFCKDNLLNEITKYDGFWTDDDDQVLAAVRKGFLDTHNAMWTVLDSWPKTVTGLPSTAGSTATIAIIKQGKLYTGHVGDSALVLGQGNVYAGDEFPYQAVCITKEHKPDDPDERLRIEDAGGEVINKSGVPRVVWSRPKTSHKGPVRRSTQIDQIPFLAVARSLGDLWSYDYYTETYVVSPDPDVTVMKLDPSKHRCLILASDGLWNMLTPEEAVNVVMDLETQFEQKIISDPSVSLSFWSNPAERLVFRALNKWRSKSLKADNTSCVVVLIDPLGPSKLTLLKQKRQALLSGGEITAQLNKVPQLATEIDHRNKTRNKNTNCSLSDIRAIDCSILNLVTEREKLLKQSLTVSSKLHLRHSREEYYKEYLSESAQSIPKSPVKWKFKHFVEAEMPMDSNISNQSRKMSMLSSDYHILNPREGLHNKSGVVFTKLVETLHGDNEGKLGMRVTEQIQSLNSCHLINNNHGHMNDDEKTENVEDVRALHSDLEIWLSKPLSTAPCSEIKKIDENGRDTSLHSSTDATNKAFSLASDESIESPKSYFGDDNHPPTSLSSPAKLSSPRIRRDTTCKRAKRKLSRNGRRHQNLSKPLLGVNTNPVTLFNFPTSVDKISNSTHEAADICSRIDTAQVSAEDKIASNDITRGADNVAAAPPVLTKDLNIKTLTNPNYMTSPLKCMSQPSQVQKSFKSVKEKVRSSPYTGLTLDISRLMSEMPTLVLNNTGGACTTSADITTHILSSGLAADTADSKSAFTPGFQKQTNKMIGDKVPHNSSVLALTEPLKQLNKTGPVRKARSRRWGHFLQTSKQGIDQLFHLRNHHKGITKLEPGNFRIISSKNSLLAPRLNTSQSHHQPDVTGSHQIDLTVNVSSVAVDDLVRLSGEVNMQSAAKLTTIQHSLLENGLPDNISKKCNGLFQKSKLTLRRSSKVAKGAFFPVNHRLFLKSSGKKRRGGELFPTPEIKRRRQVDANRI